MGIIRTGKYLDSETNARLREKHAMAPRIPAIVIVERHLGPNARTEDERLQAEAATAVDAACVAAGLPEPEKDADGDTIHYGVDFGSGEVLLWDGEP